MHNKETISVNSYIWVNNQGLDEAVLYYISYMYNKETISVNSYKDELDKSHVSSYESIMALIIQRWTGTSATWSYRQRYYICSWNSN